MTALPSIEHLSGWGNYPRQTCHLYRPAATDDLAELLRSPSERNFIARGLGRAYGDAALNQESGVILQTPFDRRLDFDEQTGILGCQAGVSIAQILAQYLPQGWALPTTPGTKFVTVGGAIAADAHGKNHRVDGSFSCWVVDFELLTADGNVITCSPTSNADLFWPTVGGMGLTGIILRARLQLRRVETAYLRVEVLRTANLDATLECFAEAARYRYAAAWIDCLARGGSLGRSVVMLGDDAAAADLPPHKRAGRLRLPRRLPRFIPPFFPHALLNASTMRLYNASRYGMQREGEQLLNYDQFFYPLDAIAHWNRAYGPRGFVQYQVALPTETSRAGLTEILEATSGGGEASFLAVLKAAGPASGGLLSFLDGGHTLAMDFKNTGDDLLKLVARLDRIVLKHRGRLYLAKDALMSAEMFAATYPAAKQFQAIKERIDPACRFSSSQARRLGIVHD